MALTGKWPKKFSYNAMRQFVKYMQTQNLATQALAIDGTNAENIQTTGGGYCILNGVHIASLAADDEYDISLEPPYAAWAVSTSYTTGGILSEVVGRSGAHYVCILAHTSSAADEPEFGANWQTYWKLLSHWAVKAVGNSIAQNKQAHYLVCAQADGILRAFIAYTIGTEGATTELVIPPYDPERYVAVGYVTVKPTSGAHVFGTTVLTTVGTFTQLLGPVFPDGDLADIN